MDSTLQMVADCTLLHSCQERVLTDRIKEVRMKLSVRIDESFAFKIEVFCARENIYEYIYSNKQRSLNSFIASGEIAVPPSLWKWNLLLDALKW